MGGVKYRDLIKAETANPGLPRINRIKTDVGAVVKSYQKECRITFIYENALLYFFFKPCIPYRYFCLGIFQ